MDYFEFIKLASEEGFEYPRELYILSRAIDIVDYEDFISRCIETYFTEFAIPEFEYDGHIHYVMNESDAQFCVDCYRDILIIKATNEIPDIYHSYVKFVEFSEHVYTSIYDIFDNIYEFEAEVDSVILPKSYVVTC